MNFLIDESASLGLVHALREANNTVLAIAEIAQRGISDNEVWSLTKQQSDGILITRDYHLLILLDSIHKMLAQSSLFDLETLLLAKKFRLFLHLCDAIP